jgi:hypothetical protein
LIDRLSAQEELAKTLQKSSISHSYCVCKVNLLHSAYIRASFTANQSINLSLCEVL